MRMMQTKLNANSVEFIRTLTLSADVCSVVQFIPKFEDAAFPLCVSNVEHFQYDTCDVFADYAITIIGITKAAQSRACMFVISAEFYRSLIADVAAWFAIKLIHVSAPVRSSLFVIAGFCVFNAAYLPLRTLFAAVSVVIASMSIYLRVYLIASGV